MKFLQYSILVGVVVLFCSCGSYFNQPVDYQDARIGESTNATTALKNLPLPEEPVVVGVYNFRDLTGQYKPSEMGSTFSTAVTQGATSILIKALEDSKWFTTIERENVGNLLNERNIIRSTRQEYRANSNTNEPQLPPLLYAGIILEGGIVSYDTNIITGGLGARYFGVGGSTQYRQDRVTIYLRAVSTSSGRILKNVYISKTILSQALDASLFKYVSFQRLMEAETGFTRNEPVQLAVTEAIEKGVEALVLEGIQDNLWTPREDQQPLANELIALYNTEKEDAGMESLYDRKFIDKTGSSIGVNVGTSLMSGDFSNTEAGGMLRVDYTNNIFPSLSVNLAANAFELKNQGAFSEKFVGIDVNGQYNVLPNDTFGPYLSAGGGVIFGLDSDEVSDGMSSTHFKLQYGLGLEYMITDKLGIRGFAEHNLMFNDELDRFVHGKRNDHYFNFSIGLNFHLGKTKRERNNNLNNQ